ncbi:hypothetical protein HN695_02210 [Candidatus Woesearchaeota archaeon]|jgi:hypothetical protein|nr:hypothetical protein [Candidatus Woesearchaeota archaeon]MBT5272899.1 hypothetical protein [Candidatus Woesearchaeota archaeon]MBT6041365.1 hypothetical protein [Candidatus Woesearchaeota archaeon]MBT6337248.1 hypothetical protein [Candidatus Woesearchaeota archaeon]MBT7927125.1 hypothetical protein [Candidatus Woesearchaeota archaeon]
MKIKEYIMKELFGPKKTLVLDEVIETGVVTIINYEVHFDIGCPGGSSYTTMEYLPFQESFLKLREKEDGRLHFLRYFMAEEPINPTVAVRREIGELKDCFPRMHRNIITNIDHLVLGQLVGESVEVRMRSSPPKKVVELFLDGAVSTLVELYSKEDERYLK